MPPQQRSKVQLREWDQLDTVLMHCPNDGGELRTPGLHAASALFEAAFDPEAAAAEHQVFQDILHRRGARVVRVIDVFLHAPREEQEKLVSGNIKIDFSGEFSSADKIKHRSEVLKSISTYSSEELFKVIFQQPTITLKHTDRNTKLVASYTITPLSNMFFMRDQSITTARGRVICRLHSAQRSNESNLLEFVYRQMGEVPLLTVKEPGFIEGGDFIPAGDYAFQGIGLRTNMEGIQQVMDADAYGSKYVAVVKDRWCDQEEMHLDTYFNIINRSTVVLVEPRFDATPDSKYYTTVDKYVYNAHKKGYELEEENVGLVAFLRGAGFTTIIPVPKRDQLLYGCNFVTVNENSIVLVKRDDGVSSQYKDALLAAGVLYFEAPMTNLTKGYGAAHCTTQITRKPASGSAQQKQHRRQHGASKL